MVGLDSKALDALDFERALARVQSDSGSDFIPAPHFASIYQYASGGLVEFLRTELANGSFSPGMPITIEVLKLGGLTRPGTILTPADRVLYQAIADLLAPPIEAQLDRSRVFSNVLRDDPLSAGEMFEPASHCFSKMKLRIAEICTAPVSHVIKADVSNYFERIYQHNLINLLLSAGCGHEYVNLLEKLLLAWTNKNSHGILQGMYPSDLLGNFYLSGLDADCEIRGIPSVRFVDDLYLFFSNLKSAFESRVDLCAYLRKIGLNLNERKSRIVGADEALREETDIDRMFEEARSEVSASDLEEAGYGWLMELTPGEVPDIETEAILRLYDQRNSISEQVVIDKVDQFCLPIFSALRLDVALDDALLRMPQRPHMARTYCHYLASLAPKRPEIVGYLQQALREPTLLCDWLLLWPAMALNTLNPGQVQASHAVRWLREFRHSEAVRAVCAVLVGKHGTAPQRELLRNHYQDEPSEYVRAAMVFAAQYFPSAERNACLGTWGERSKTNALIAKAVKALLAAH